LVARRSRRKGRRSKGGKKVLSLQDSQDRDDPGRVRKVRGLEIAVNQPGVPKKKEKSRRGIGDRQERGAGVGVRPCRKGGKDYLTSRDRARAGGKLTGVLKREKGTIPSLSGTTSIRPRDWFDTKFRLEKITNRQQSILRQEGSKISPEREGGETLKKNDGRDSRGEGGNIDQIKKTPPHPLVPAQNCKE